MSQPLQDQLNRDIHKLESQLDSTRIVYIYVQYKDLDLKPIDVKKAASVLNLPADQEDKLKAALTFRGAATFKALDSFAKKQKPPTNAKAMITKLRQGGLLPDPAKIEERFLGPSPL